MKNLRVKDSDRTQKNIWNDSNLTKASDFERNEKFRMLLQLFYYSELRIGEALGLTPKDILDDGTTAAKPDGMGDEETS